MFFWNSLAFSMISLSLVPLPFLNPAWTSGSSWFTYCWSLAWRILSITLLACEMSALCGSLNVLWHCLSLGLEWKLNFSSPVVTAEFSKFAGILSAALSQHHLVVFEIAHDPNFSHYWLALFQCTGTVYTVSDLSPCVSYFWWCCRYCFKFQMSNCLLLVLRKTVNFCTLTVHPEALLNLLKLLVLIPFL